MAENVPSASTEVTGPNPDMPPTVIVLGMAGSGKTSFIQVYLHKILHLCVLAPKRHTSR